MKVHKLDCDRHKFQNIYNRVISFEIRPNNQEYRVGDSLHILEYCPTDKKHTGRWVSKRITCIVSCSEYGLSDNYIVMALA
jgi:hypothetical protein